MTFVESFKIISTLFVGLSILVTFYIYQRSTEREYFKKFRDAFIEYMGLLNEMNELFDNIALVELGHSISQQLREIIPQNLSSPEEIHEFTHNPENKNYIRQAVYLGISKSKTVARSKEIDQELQKILLSCKSTFPIFRASLSLLRAQYFATIGLIYSGNATIELFETAIDEYQKNNDGDSDDDLGDIISHISLMFRETAIDITNHLGDIVNEYESFMFEQTYDISHIILNVYISKSDRELRYISKQELSQIDAYIHNAESVETKKIPFEYLKFYQKHEYISQKDWNTIVECKTKIESRFANQDDD